MRFRKPATFDFTDNNVGVSVSDCRDEDGITIGLIDGIIAICRILKDRDFNNPNVKEALKDLGGDSDLRYILDGYYSTTTWYELYGHRGWDDVMDEFKATKIPIELTDDTLQYKFTLDGKEYISKIPIIKTKPVPVIHVFYGKGTVFGYRDHITQPDDDAPPSNNFAVHLDWMPSRKPNDTYELVAGGEFVFMDEDTLKLWSEDEKLYRSYHEDIF